METREQRIIAAVKLLRSCSTLNELKQAYRALMLQNHPDKGGDEEVAKAINMEFSSLFEVLKNRNNEQAEREHAEGRTQEHHTTTETPEEFIEIVSRLAKIEGIIIELCGCWLWISGTSFEDKETQRKLKDAGCKWSKCKKQWYWRHEEDWCKKHSKHTLSLEEIRDIYGSQTIGQTAQTSLVFA